MKVRLGISRTIYVNVDSPNLGFTYFNFLGGYQLKKHPVFVKEFLVEWSKRTRSFVLMLADPCTLNAIGDFPQRIPTV